MATYKTETKLTTPTIHDNGTSAKGLSDGYAEAYAAVQTAYEYVRATVPNSRDYYVQGPAAMDAATAEHMTRLRKLHDVMNELEQLAIYCDMA